MNRESNVPFMLSQALFDNQSPHIFTDFIRAITFNYGDDINRFFENVEEALNQGFWLCGYFAYEFGYFLEPSLEPLRKTSAIPLAWLGVFTNPLLVNDWFDKTDAGFGRSIKNVSGNISYEEYSARIKKIKCFLEEGLTYQVNYTFKNKFEFEGSVFDFYAKLRSAQPTSHGAFINTGDDVFLSFSPELFFKIKDGIIQTRPMKGTVARGRSFACDESNKQWLKSSRKIKAENIMIVDLLRNDLGRIAKRVWVPKLFEVEKYRTLYQMTSTVEAELKNNVTFKDIFSSLFPCGSVTGAPKIKTMQIINQLEAEPRGIYTGAIGYISPKREASFNVAIRTIHLKGNNGQMGIGGGIVYDSVDRDEYAEALLKAKFLSNQIREFFLVETILWEAAAGFFLFDLHLQRLENTCEYFSIPLDTSDLTKKFKVLENSLTKLKEKKWKIRALVSMDGKINMEKEEISHQPFEVKIKISTVRVNPDDEFLYHKTTQRFLYNRELHDARKSGFFDVVFLNNRGEVTEGAISNIFVEKKGKMYTPPVKSGLLPGVFREYLLARGEAIEKILYLEDIYQADKIYIGNSVRKLMPVSISLGKEEMGFSLRKLSLSSIIEK
ncbi:MAG: aminodeoxychorismate synthase component I [Candidatus Omnitrophica bacterium]|nr:aminodeoxychorismate synthase component I [Candidatus Omnitrophota bacterium]